MSVRLSEAYSPRWDSARLYEYIYWYIFKTMESLDESDAEKSIMELYSKYTLCTKICTPCVPLK